MKNTLLFHWQELDAPPPQIEAPRDFYSGYVILFTRTLCGGGAFILTNGQKPRVLFQGGGVLQQSPKKGRASDLGLQIYFAISC